MENQPKIPTELEKLRQQEKTILEDHAYWQNILKNFNPNDNPLGRSELKLQAEIDELDNEWKKIKSKMAQLRFNKKQS